MTHTNNIYLGDCINVMQQLENNSIDLIVTDPPYLVNYQDRTGRKIVNDVNHDWLEPAFTDMYRILRNNSFAISFYGWNHVEKFMTACGGLFVMMVGSVSFLVMSN